MKLPKAFKLSINTSAEDGIGLVIACTHCDCLIFFGHFVIGQEVEFDIPSSCPLCPKENKEEIK